MEKRDASFTKEEFYEVADIIRKHKDVTVINPNGMAKDFIEEFIKEATNIGLL